MSELDPRMLEMMRQRAQQEAQPPTQPMMQPPVPQAPPVTPVPPEARGEMPPEGMTRVADIIDNPEATQPMNKDRIREAGDILRRYKAGKISVERRIQAAQQWWKLKNWEQEEKDTGRKGATKYKGDTAWLWNCIVGKHADAIAAYPEPIVLPRVADDKEEAKRLSTIVPVVLEANDFEETYNDCQWQKMQEGTACYGTFWDKTKLNGLGDIAIRKINILNLFWEPGITDIQESRNVFLLALRDNDLLESEYPQLKNKLGGKNFSLTEYRTDDNVDTTGKSIVVDWYYKRYEHGQSVLHYCKYCGDEILYSTENEGMPGLYEDGEYPFVLDPLFPVEGSPCGYGYIDIGKDTQADIDLLNQAIVTNAAMNATPRYFQRQDSGINEKEFADFTRPIVHVSGPMSADAIMPIVTPPLPGNAVDVMNTKIEELKFITGNTDVANGGNPSGVTAASAIAALQESAGRTSRDSTKAAYRAYRKVVTMVIERIRQFYELPRQFRITGDRGQEEFIDYSNAGLQLQTQGQQFGMDMGMRKPVFDIDVRAQSENPFNKVSQNELAIQLLQLGVYNPQQADMSLMMLDMMDFKGKDELMQKIQQMQTMQQQLARYQQIALMLAQRVDPNIAEQLSAEIMGGMPGQAMPMGGAVPNGQYSDLRDPGGSAGQTMVNRARARAQQSSQPE